MEHFDWIKGFLFPYINFVLFVLILTKYAARPLRVYLEGRAKKFRAEAQEAKRQQEAAANQLAILKEKMSRLQQDLASQKQQVEGQARLEADNIVAKGHLEAKRIKDEAQKAAAAEVEKARNRIYRNLIDQVRIKTIEKLKSDLSRDEVLRINTNQINRVSKLT